MSSTIPTLSKRTYIGNIVLGVLFILIGLSMALTQHGAKYSIIGTFRIDGTHALICGVGFCIWGLIMLFYTFRRYYKEKKTAEQGAAANP